MKKQRIIAAITVFAMYLLTGATCVVIGSSIPSLMQQYSKSLSAISVLASAFAIGRVATVFIVGAFTEKFGAKLTLTIGVINFILFLFGAMITTNYFVALVLSALAGVGMSTQDTCCAIILKQTFPESYSSSLSAGQAFFSIGCFISPLLMGIALAQELNFKIVYFIIGIIGILMLILIPFLKLPQDKKVTSSQQFNIRCFNLKKNKWKYICFGIMCFTYFGTTNTIHTYTSTFVQSFGIDESISVSVLTVYSVGCMIGSFAFIPILKKVSETKILWINMLLTFICLVVAAIYHIPTVFFITYFIAGFFCGVLFSLLISISVSLNPLHAGMAAAAVGFVGGGADILSPLITGFIIRVTSVKSIFYYCTVMCIICVISSFLYRIKYKRNPNTKEPLEILECN
ncbi:MFS transporter [Vallitalea longa]|uniref:MFS transporter n=1 Tax=Vallitalea longa TaxID=2936439 RepID=A0A9W5YFY1_9FIRM|nr:MFS transporter [Vallitalea longa]GKX31790.1 MFS transporter [Vallitalea longa]